MVEPLEVGSKKQPFIDEYIIDETHGVLRTLNQPVKYAGNPVMIPLYPWEGRIELYGTVRRDPDGGFRMWYTGLGGMGIPPIGPSTSDSCWKDFDASNLLYTICYTTSKDGIFWERPNLGIVEHDGSKDNNLALTDAAFGNVIKDPRDPDPSRLYKSLFFEAHDSRGGLIAVAVLDESGTEHSGFSRADCALFDGDSVSHNMTWREKASMDELRGRVIRLKFYLRSARLYSFAVADRE